MAQQILAMDPQDVEAAEAGGKKTTAIVRLGPHGAAMIPIHIRHLLPGNDAYRLVELATVSSSFDICYRRDIGLPKSAKQIEEEAISRRLACAVTASAPAPPRWLAGATEYAVAAAVAGLVVWVLFAK